MNKTISKVLCGLLFATTCASASAIEICRNYYETLPDYVGGGYVYFRLCCDTQTLNCRLDDGPIDFPEEP